MKSKIYIRVGRGTTGSLRGRSYVRASGKLDHTPLENADGPVPTVYFAVAVDIPDSLFAQAERVIAELDVTADSAKVAAEIQVPE